MIIRPVESKDIDTILELNEKSVKVLSPLNRPALLGLIEMSILTVVVEEDHQVAGFLIGLTQGVAYESINYAWFNNQYEAFFYVDRIVVSDQFRGQGIASKLYEYLIFLLKLTSYHQTHPRYYSTKSLALRNLNY
jgi:predicted GNAT superfamily acetyltransferase